MEVGLEVGLAGEAMVAVATVAETAAEEKVVGKVAEATVVVRVEAAMAAAMVMPWRQCRSGMPQRRSPGRCTR